MATNIKNIGPRRKGKIKQGYYKIKNSEKYIGDPSNIIYRSSWEHRFMVYCDISSHVLEWSSEPIAIDYISPIDNRKHKYFIDFYMKINTGKVEKQYLIEVKPKSQYFEKPVLEGKKTPKKKERYKKALETWIINNAKFKYAMAYCKSVGMEFKIINETHLSGIRI